MVCSNVQVNVYCSVVNYSTDIFAKLIKMLYNIDIGMKMDYRIRHKTEYL